PLDARLAIMGEAPGKQEAEAGRPFVGRAGKLLDQLLEEAGIDRSETYVTNVVKLRPTTESKGRLKNRPPRAGEIREGLEVLRSELEIVDPAVLVLLGSVPAKALIERSFTLSSGRGSWFDSQLGIPALATYHPAYLLRLRGADFERTRELVVEDLRKAWEQAR
ncbi:MAG TPA: uracil-DNA glycosylase, partial [Rubrobacteraceae bacterium]|nr:uracil-DNA glycosylase [Rubrobacteraceae bacterium]